VVFFFVWGVNDVDRTKNKLRVEGVVVKQKDKD